MSYCAVNNEPVFQATIAFPRLGAWHADLAIASDTAPTGAVTLTFGTGAITWQGFAYRGGAPFDTATLRVVGGAGGIATGQALTAQAYQSTPFSIPLNDILGATGEKLSPNADPTVLNTVLRSWTRLIGPAGMALTALCSSVGASWRFMPDGSLWVGIERWPTDTEAYTLLTDEPMYGQQDVYADAPSMQPGTVLNGRKVSYVQHKFRETTLRTEVLYEDQTAIGFYDRVKSPLAAFIKSVSSNLYTGQWEGVIVSQSSNQTTVDFKPDDPRIPSMQAVPLKLGTAFVTATLSTPCRGVLFFANQDPQKPRVGLLDSDAEFSRLVIANGTEGAARNSDPVQVTFTTADAALIIAPAGAGGGPCSAVGPITLTGMITAGSTRVLVG